VAKQIKLFKGGDTEKLVESANEFMKDIPENDIYQVIGVQSGFSMRIQEVIMIVYREPGKKQ